MLHFLGPSHKKINANLSHTPNFEQKKIIFITYHSPFQTIIRFFWWQIKIMVFSSNFPVHFPLFFYFHDFFLLFSLLIFSQFMANFLSLLFYVILIKFFFFESLLSSANKKIGRKISLFVKYVIPFEFLMSYSTPHPSLFYVWYEVNNLLMLWLFWEYSVKNYIMK